MEIEKGKTYKYLREKRGVSDAAKENLKNFNRIKKSILDALSDEELNVGQLAQKVSMPKDEVVFYLMTLVKYGMVEPAGIDDMDEYYFYKLKK
jgi:predicted Rossmann fold nucleotide-binding protein DprA/Smf involved in DNA uptake